MSCAISSASEEASPAQRQHFKIREYDVWISSPPDRYQNGSRSAAEDRPWTLLQTALELEESAILDQSLQLSQ